jgi:hypothetical protein
MSNRGWTRCVVLAPSDAGAGGDVDAALVENDWHLLERADDPHMALVELCIGERASAARAAWGLDRAEPPALVVVEPERWPELDDLLSAVDRFLPNTPVWSWAGGHMDSLRTGASTPTSDSPVPPEAPPPTPQAPALRLADAITDGTPTTEIDEAKAVTELSAEEIQMLREPAPEEPSP